jgi:type VI protein secretion system component Hcp
MPVLMSIDGIVGSGIIPGYEGWLLLNTFDWSGTRGVTKQSDRMGRPVAFAVAPQLHAVKVGRTGDFVTPQIWTLMLSYTRKPVEFVWLRTGIDELVPYMKLRLENALITSMGSASSFAEPDETIVFTYDEVTLSVVNVDDALRGPQDVVSYKLPQAQRG